MKAGYVEFDTKKKKRIFVTSDVGVPQGGIISPLLSNLVLHELDIYIEERKLERARISQDEPAYTANPEYTRLNSRIARLRRKKEYSELGPALRLRRRLRTAIPNPRFSQLRYVRYADD